MLSQKCERMEVEGEGKRLVVDLLRCGAFGV